MINIHIVITTILGDDIHNITYQRQRLYYIIVNGL
jgi:hypothetical protein